MCDGGISSLALYRNGLSEGCSIKTRQYLSLGIPVLAGCKDSGIDSENRFYSVVKTKNMAETFLRFREFKKVTRKKIYDYSFNSISKEKSINDLIEWLKLLKKNE